jgi:HSP20 family protein
MRTLVRKSPAVFEGFPSVFDTFFNDGFTRNFANASEKFVPAVNVSETGDAFNIEFAVPGYKKEDIQITLENDVLTVSSEISQENEEETKENYSRREFFRASFKRSFSVPESVDAERIDASYEQGVLKIQLPKRKEVIKPAAKMIQVK